MTKTILTLVLLSCTLIMSGCEDGEEGGEGTTTTAKQGWHFQGRDCLACHNSDLNEAKHLLYGATLYKDANVTNQDDLQNVCGGEFIVNFLDGGFNLIYSSKDYKAEGSNGYKAKGNLFILQRKLRLFSAGNYYIQITDANGTVMAVTNGATHSFTSQDYLSSNPADYANRLSCNACHIQGGNQKPLYVQINKNLCLKKQNK